uniref:Tissue factor pathway inhibitor n=1 Tax=Neogobius melanostomus TaxID=47308 RepID=A0A8C6S9S5_9GOBI
MDTAAVNKCLLLCALCVLSAAWSEGRRSHRHGGLQSELFIFREQCAFKAEPGPCKAIKPRFFFSIDSGRCESFEYGGCGGNDNNFLSKEECEESCVVSEDKDPCQLPEAPGPCRGLVSRYLYDPEIHDCRHFFYGGCFGNANNFRSMDACKTRCQNTDNSEQTTAPPSGEILDRTRLQPLETTDASLSPVCWDAMERGTCDGAERRYFYNSTSRRCQSFSFSGCGENGNNFLLRRQCIKTCVTRLKDHRRTMGEKMIRIRKKNLDKIKALP